MSLQPQTHRHGSMPVMLFPWQPFYSPSLWRHFWSIHLCYFMLTENKKKELWPDVFGLLHCCLQAVDPDSGQWGEVKYSIYGSGAELWVSKMTKAKKGFDPSISAVTETFCRFNEYLQLISLLSKNTSTLWTITKKIPPFLVCSC